MSLFETGLSSGVVRPNDLLQGDVGFVDAPAHELVRAMRGFGGWLSGTGTALLEDASEYLRHEAAITPRRTEVDRFVNDVDDLRDDAERLEARVARLERRRVDRR